MFEDFDEEQSLRDFFEAQQRRLNQDQITYEEELHEFLKEIEQDVPTELEVEKYQKEIEASEDKPSESSLKSLVNLMQSRLSTTERFLYERQLNFLMADVVAEHEGRELTRYTNELMDTDPARYDQVQMHLERLGDLDLEELQELSDAISEGSRHVIFSEATELYINSVIADVSKFSARENLDDAETQHRDVYAFVDQVVEKTLAETPAEYHPIIQEKFDIAFEEVVDDWAEIEQRTDQIDSIKSRDFFKDIPTGFEDTSISPTTNFDSDLLGNQPNRDRFEYLRMFQKYGYPIEFQSYKVESDLAFEQKPEDLRSLIDRISFYSEDLWVTDFNDLPIERHDESEELSRFLTMGDSGEREAWRLKSLIETNEITDQELEIEPSQLKERRDDEFER